MATTVNTRGNLKPLTPKQQQALELKLQGMTDAEIAEQLGVTAGAITERLSHDHVQEAWARHQEATLKQAADVLKSAVIPICERLVKIAKHSAQEDQARMCAFGILDRVGMGPTSKHEVTGKDGAPLGVVLKADEFEAERERLMAELEEARK